MLKGSSSAPEGAGDAWKTSGRTEDLVSFGELAPCQDANARPRHANPSP